MNKTILGLSFLVTHSLASTFENFEPNSWSTYSNTSFNYSEISGQDHISTHFYQLSLNPNISKFLLRNLSTGLGISYNWNYQKSQTTNFESNSLSLTLSAQYFFTHFLHEHSGMVYSLGLTSFLQTRSNEINAYNFNRTSSFFSNYSINPAIQIQAEYFLNDRTSLYLSEIYSHQFNLNKDTYRSFNQTNHFATLLGFSIYFPSKMSNFIQ